VSHSVGNWLWLVAFTLVVKNNYVYSQARAITLDLIDGQIVARFQEAAMKEQDKRTTAGFTLVRSPVPLDLDGDGVSNFGQQSAAPLAFSEDIAATIRPVTLPAQMEVGAPPMPVEESPLTAPAGVQAEPHSVDGASIF
jgi:hypothetical protein